MCSRTVQIPTACGLFFFLSSHLFDPSITGLFSWFIQSCALSVSASRILFWHPCLSASSKRAIIIPWASNYNSMSLQVCRIIVISHMQTKCFYLWDWRFGASDEIVLSSYNTVKLLTLRIDRVRLAALMAIPTCTYFPCLCFLLGCFRE